MSTVPEYYDKYWSPSGYCPPRDTTPELERLFRKWIRPGCRCLDVGCGDGRTAGLWLRDYGCSYSGADVSKNAIERAKELGLDVVTITDAGQLPFASESFDVALSIEVFEHLFDPRSALQEMCRVTRRNGMVLVTVPNCAYWRRRLDLALLGRWNPLGDNLSVEQPWRDPHIRFFTKQSLERLVRSTPLDIMEIGGHAGSLLHDLPFIGERIPGPRNTPIYRFAERLMPSLLSYRLHVVAKRR
jgi:methionine biosynthesis protein MetW